MNSRSPMNRSLAQKFVLPIGAFGLAFLLWIFVVSGNTYSTVMQLPIEARNLNAQKAHRKEVPEFASVLLQGTGRDLFKAYLVRRFAGFKLVLDLEGISQEYEFVLNEYFDQYPQKVVLPSAYKLKFIEVIYPSRIKISLDEILVKTVPVQPMIKVELDDGYINIGSINLYPQEIEITGPKEDLVSVTQVLTYPDTFLQAREPLSGWIDIQSIGRLIEFSQNEIEFSIDIQQISERIIVDIPVLVINKRNKFRVFPSPQTVSLTVVGGMKQIANLNSDEINVTVDFNNWILQKQFYEPNVEIPSTVLDWRDLSPRTIELGVAREAG